MSDGFDAGPEAGDHTPGETPEDLRFGLDPDAAIAEHGGGAPRPPHRPAPVIDTRRYQWMIGGFGLLLIVIFSVLLYAHGGNGSPGIPPGRKLHRFVAPLATSDLNVPANDNPRCDPSRPAKRGLNVCGRRPIVLTLFALSKKPCMRQVDALQAVAPQFPQVQFAAVAVGADRAQAAQAVRRNHWTIPVAFDMNGAVGQVYGFLVCPLTELARAGGTVDQRLIGEAWERPAALAAAVRRMLRR